MVSEMVQIYFWADFGAVTTHQVDFFGGQDHMIATATYIFKKTLSPQFGGFF